MACEEWEEQISALLDGELDLSTVRSLLGHFGVCDRCARSCSRQLCLTRAARLDPLPQEWQPVNAELFPRPGRRWPEEWGKLSDYRPLQLPPASTAAEVLSVTRRTASVRRADFPGKASRLTRLGRM